MFAENLYKNPFVTNSGWNFAKYDANVHDCIVCNDIHDIATKVREYRTLFQSSGTTALGESRTSCYMKDVNTFRRPIIITMNREGQWDVLKNMPWVKENAKILDCGADKLYEEDEEDENTKRKREEHEIDLLRWEHGEQAREMHTWHKRQRLMEEDEQRQMADADDHPM